MRHTKELAIGILLAVMMTSSAHAQQRTASAFESDHRAVEVTRKSTARTSPGVARFTGGFLFGTAALVGLLAATYNNPKAVPEPLVYAGYAVGTAAGASIATSIWEKPNSGLWWGAAIGALPLLAAMAISDDGAAGNAFLAAWVGAPLGAAIGQQVRRKR